MASLYIKDAETNELAEELADRRGLTKTAAVKLALRHELERGIPGDEIDRRPTRERMLDFWKLHPLPEKLGVVPDKTFYDDLSGGL